MAVAIAVKVAIVALVLMLPSGLALSLGAAHGVALLLVAVVAVVLLVVRHRKRGSHEMSIPGERHTVAAEAVIETTNAGRYLDQLCRHATKFGHRLRHVHANSTHARPEVLGVDRHETRGVVDLSWGRCTVDAGPTTLTVRIEAVDDQKLRQVQGIIAADLERFGRKEELAVIWQPVTTG